MVHEGYQRVDLPEVSMWVLGVLKACETQMGSQDIGVVYRAMVQVHTWALCNQYSVISTLHMFTLDCRMWVR